MLENLAERFTKIIKIMRGETRLTESNMSKMLREIRITLLEADVALSVVRSFIATIQKKAIGQKIIDSLTPGQMLVGIVQNELASLMGANLDTHLFQLNFLTQPPAIILIVGLHGAGKTTTIGKLVKYLQKDKIKKIITVSTDIYRPAAINQLKIITNQVKADFFQSDAVTKPVDIALSALNYAKNHYYDVLIIDTAGRLSIDEIMMKEIGMIHTAIKPIETLFIIDVMIGQDAVNIAKTFNDTLPLTGIILTKLDGDARGGVALSVHNIIGKPIKFISATEKLDGLEVFNPHRMVNRILGMSDILELVEEARKNVDVSVSQDFAKKIKDGSKFNLNDFKTQLSQIKKINGLSNLLNKLPISMKRTIKNTHSTVEIEKQVRRMEGIINSMTIQERIKPELIKASRKRRIANGSGVQVQTVNHMLSQFEQMKSIMKNFKGNNIIKMMHGLKSILPK